MARYILSVEAMNFIATVYDTQKLPVVRGSSLWLTGLSEACKKALAGAGATNLTELVVGAEKARFAFDAGDEQGPVAAVKSALQEDLWPHFTVAVDCVPAAAGAEAAEARNKSAQFRRWTFPPFEAGQSIRPDAWDKKRPATTELSGREGERIAVSASVKARWKHGREQRRGFWRDKDAPRALEGVAFCDELSEIVKNPPKSVPESARNKIAVIHLDGDGFGEAAKSDRAGFNAYLSDKMNGLKRHIVGSALKDDEQTLRLEALVWGGDDITLVTPAWRALTFFKEFYEFTANWTFGQQSLGFTGAAVIAHYKSPMRQMTGLAQEAVRLAKAAGARGGFSVDVFESVSLPERSEDLEKHRNSFYGQNVTPVGLSFKGADACALNQKLRDLREKADNALPARSKLHDLAQQKNPEQELENYAKRLKGGLDEMKKALTLPGERCLQLNLALALMLWDYAPREGETCAESR